MRRLLIITRYMVGNARYTARRAVRLAGGWALLSVTFQIKCRTFFQYLRQLRKSEGGLRDMHAAQAGDVVENLGQ